MKVECKGVYIIGTCYPDGVSCTVNKKSIIHLIFFQCIMSLDNSFSLLVYTIRKKVEETRINVKKRVVSLCLGVFVYPNSSLFLARLHEVQKSYCSHPGRTRSRSRSRSRSTLR